MNFLVEEMVIIGIRNPYLYISGFVDSDNYKVIIKSNCRDIDELKGLHKRPDIAEEYGIDKNKLVGFSKAVKLKKKDKKILVKIETEKGVIFEKTINNNLFLKVIKTSSNLVKRAFFKVMRIAKAILILCWDFIRCPKIFFNKKYRRIYMHNWRFGFGGKILDFNNKKQYQKYIRKIENKNEQIQEFSYNPLISIVIPVYNVPENFLDECIESILNQTYQNFEICLADDNSPDPNVKKILEKWMDKDKRIKVVFRKENGRISKATNSALEIATGEFIALVDNDDLLTKDALYEVVKVLNEDKTIDFIYTDEDKLDVDGEICFPHYKADYSPDTLLSINYITHFAVLRKSIVEEIGGFRSEYDGAQDYDIFLRFVEKTNNIYHIPKVLYHWRMSETSTAMNIDSKSYCSVAGQKALDDTLRRRGIKGKAHVFKFTSYYLEYEYEKDDFVSIIIPTKDKFAVLKKCIDSLYKTIKFDNFEIIIVDNNSSEKETLDYFKKLKEEHNNIKVLTINKPFNYAYLNNEAVKEAKGNYLLFLNNDIEAIKDGWLEKMLGFANQEHVGAVGAKLLYPNKTVQHAGIVLGLGNFAIASHPFMGYPDMHQGPFSRITVPYNYSAVTGACLMIKKEKFLAVGGFDEKLEVSYNDVDLNLKLLKHGLYNVFLPQIKLYHYESLTRAKNPFRTDTMRTLKEIIYMQEKWGSLLTNDPFYNPNYSLKYPFMLNEKK